MPAVQPTHALTTYPAISDYLHAIPADAALVLEYDAGRVLATVEDARADYAAGEPFTIPGASDL